MNLPAAPSSKLGQGGFSLLEVSLVISVMLGLAVFIGFGFNSVRDWQRGKDGALALQAAYAAQRSYMADFPAANIATVPVADVLPYLPQGWAGKPPPSGLNGETLAIDYTVMPPVLLNGGSTYDPSPRTNDGLWDVGE